MIKTKYGRLFLTALAFFVFTFSAGAEEINLSLPDFYLNDQPENPRPQDLSGFLTRPLRLLVQRNNRLHGKGFMQPYALGVWQGDDFRIELASPPKGMRITLYRIFRDTSGSRYMSMPLSIYYNDFQKPVYVEKIEPFKEEFFIIVYEQTDSPNEKDVHVRYFEERVRNLMITSLRTNFTFSSLKLKMKDYAGDGAEGFFTRDAQDMVSKLIHPKRVFFIRLWPAESSLPDAQLIEISSDKKAT